MRSRFTTVLLVVALAAFGAGGVYTASAHLGKGHNKGHHHAKKHHRKHHKRHHQNQQGQSQNTQGSNGDSSAQTQYGTRPGKGCGDRNHVHTGPPGNPSNTACPPQSRHTGTTGSDSAAKTKHHARHHGKKTRRHHKRRRHGHS